jgi:hypothetical protein
MIRINLEYLFGLHERLARLAELELAQTKVANVVKTLTACGATLLGIYGVESLYRPHLHLSFNQADRLFTEIDKHVQAFGNDPNVEITATEIATIHEQYATFRVVFQADLASVNAYLVSPRKPYDLSTLLTEGPSLFPQGMPSKAPETMRDSEEAGKALAFELGTACGFHTFRIVEAVLKRYWDKESGGQDRPNLETIGNYAREMENRKIGDTKTIESLKQIAKLHRNPLIHPEVLLTVEEAIDTLGIARSVIGAMLRVLPEVPPTTVMAVQAHEAPVRHSTDRL